MAGEEICPVRDTILDQYKTHSASPILQPDSNYAVERRRDLCELTHGTKSAVSGISVSPDCEIGYASVNTSGDDGDGIHKESGSRPDCHQHHPRPHTIL